MDHSSRPDRGMVTAELAMGLIALMLAVAAGIGLIGVALVQGQCWDTASEVARQVARGDRAALDRAKNDAPAGARVTIGRDADVAVVTVRATARPFGPRGPGVDLSATARVVAEPGVKP
ncbi:TadE family type IV pilus minor pilin [Mariniluteicoccus flavus]